MKIEIIEMQQETAMAIRTTTTMAEIHKAIDKGFAKVYTYVAEAGGKVSNVPYLKYLNMGEPMDIEIGFPVAAALPEKDGVIVSHTPSGKAVAGTYTGSYKGLEGAYAEMFKFIKDNALAPDGTAYDFYLNDPSITPEVDLLTKIVVPIKEGTMTFCQSCGMPLMSDDVFGTDKNGCKNEDYCSYCYKDGAFTSECTMEEMIDFCAPVTAQHMKITPEEATAQMKEFFPKLKRWK